MQQFSVCRDGVGPTPTLSNPNVTPTLRTNLARFSNSLPGWSTGVRGGGEPTVFRGGETEDRPRDHGAVEALDDNGRET